MPPTEFGRMLLPELFPAEILAAVEILIGQKRIAAEKQRVMMPAVMNAFFKSQREPLESRIGGLRKARGDTDKLDRILRRFVPAWEPSRTDPVP